MANCGNCAETIPGDNKFCPNCGYAVEVYTQKARVPGGSKTWLAIVLVPVLVLGGYAGWRVSEGTAPGDLPDQLQRDLASWTGGAEGASEEDEQPEAKADPLDGGYTPREALKAWKALAQKRPRLLKGMPSAKATSEQVEVALTPLAQAKQQISKAGKLMRRQNRKKQRIWKLLVQRYDSAKATDRAIRTASKLTSEPEWFEQQRTPLKDAYAALAKALANAERKPNQETLDALCQKARALREATRALDRRLAELPPQLKRTRGELEGAQPGLGKLKSKTARSMTKLLPDLASDLGKAADRIPRVRATLAKDATVLATLTSLPAKPAKKGSKSKSGKGKGAKSGTQKSSAKSSSE